MSKLSQYIQARYEAQHSAHNYAKDRLEGLIRNHNRQVVADAALLAYTEYVAKGVNNAKASNRP